MPYLDTHKRRNFLGLAAATAGMVWGSSRAQSSTFTLKAAADFGPIKQIQAGKLDIGFVEQGPSDGPPVLLLHGWPYDIHTYEVAAPLLAAAGYRVIVPYLRGFGTTNFVSQDEPRNGQQSVSASDAIALLDALGIERAIVAGCDWGARTACILAALWPERCTALVSVSGYLIGSQKAQHDAFATLD